MRILFFLPLLLLAPNFAGAENPDWDAHSAAIVLGGPEVVETIHEAKTVTAQRIDSEVAPNRAAAQEHPTLIILGEPFPLPEAEAKALKKVLTSAGTYLSPSKICTFRANVRYGFLAPPRPQVDLVLCFGCGEMEVWREGKMLAFGPFDGGYGEILAITQRLFPKDEFLADFDPEVFRERAARMQVERPQ